MKKGNFFSSEYPKRYSLKFHPPEACASYIKYAIF